MSSNAALQPNSIDEVRDAVLASTRVKVVGNQTKPPLCSHHDSCDVVSLGQLSGVVEYQPSEYTFTALAGTKVSEVADVLAERGQYLPFDPMRIRAGATLGGTIASGLSGPGRFRYGSIRDFLIGAKLMLGDATVVHVGGKVVKNAAGFDIPKLLVGSAGELGAMLEVTFKVFPKPPATATLKLPCESSQQATDRMADAALRRWELDAIDYHYDTSTLYMRQRGPAEANRLIAAEIESQFGNLERLDEDEANAFWNSITELNWSGDGSHVVKIPSTTRHAATLCDTIAAAMPIQLHISGCGNVVWAALTEEDGLDELESLLVTHNHRGLCVCGPSNRTQLNPHNETNIEAAVQQAFDPTGRFKS